MGATQGCEGLAGFSWDRWLLSSVPTRLCYRGQTLDSAGERRQCMDMEYGGTDGLSEVEGWSCVCPGTRLSRPQTTVHP